MSEERNRQPQEADQPQQSQDEQQLDLDNVTRPDLKALADRVGMTAGLADELRDGFRELKRSPGGAKRITAMLHGLARKPESEARQIVSEVVRLAETIQRPRER